MIIENKGKVYFVKEKENVIIVAYKYFSSHFQFI